MEVPLKYTFEAEGILRDRVSGEMDGDADGTLWNGVTIGTNEIVKEVFGVDEGVDPGHCDISLGVCVGDDGVVHDEVANRERSK